MLFVDGHFHWDLLKQRAGKGDFDEIMQKSPFFNQDYKLEFGIANFCYNIPTRRQLQDMHPSFLYSLGIHPKEAPRVDFAQVKFVLKACRDEKLCVALGEMGLDYAGSYHKSKSVQQHVFRSMLKDYVKYGMWDKALVIHCRDEIKWDDAQRDCRKIMCEELLNDKKFLPDIYLHSFNSSAA